LAKLYARSALVVAPASHDKPPQEPQPAPPQSLSQVSPPLSQIYFFFKYMIKLNIIYK